MRDLREISVEEFAQRYQSAQAGATDDLPQLVDVREPEELSLARLDGFINLPLSQYPEWSGQIHQYLEADREVIVMCHHGMRSAQMCLWLQQQGFSQVQNLAGGIAAYAQRIDPSVPQY